MQDLKKEVKQANINENFRTPEANIETKESAVQNEKEPVEKNDSQEKYVPKKTHNQHHSEHHLLHAVRDPLTQKIEKVLEENVSEAYNRLSPIAKEEFKIKGEATAKKIATILSSTNFKIKKIFQLIMEWLKMLPGINIFFLEQEAKIKTDKIVELHRHK